MKRFYLLSVLMVILPGSKLIIRDEGVVNMAPGKHLIVPKGAIVNIESGVINI